MTARTVWEIFRDTINAWLDDNAPMHGAALAYYTVFSLAPLLIIVIAISGFVFGEEAARGQIFDQMRSVIGDEGGRALQDMVQNASSKPGTGLWATVIGVVVLLFGASGVFGQLQTSLNLIWGVQAKPGRGVWGIVQGRFLSFGFILVAGFLLLVSLLLTTALSFVAAWGGGFAPGVEAFARALDFGLGFGAVAFLFALIFKFLPDVEIDWKDVWVGALMTSALFTIGKFVLGLYLGRSGVSSTFGAAGSLIVVLLWVYYSAQILFLGAELTQVWANRFGARVRPSAHAVAVELQPAKPVKPGQVGAEDFRDPL